jgi:hypothetical protein
MIRPDAGGGWVTLEEGYWRKMVVDVTVGGRGVGDVDSTRVSTEFRRHGIPFVFFASVYSVFRVELAKIPAEFRLIPCCIIP